MKTSIHKVTIRQWGFVVLFNCLIVLRDSNNYSRVLGGKQGNLIEFTVFSLNDVYFVVLAGVVSAWVLIADFKEIAGTDILAMIRFKGQAEYFKARMFEEGLRIFSFTVLAFMLRIMMAVVKGYKISGFWYIVSEYDGCTFFVMLYLIIELFIAIFGYLCFFAWIRENVGEMTKNGFLKNVLPALFPITELAILKSLDWRFLPYLPIGNILLNYQQYNKGLIGKGVYWLLMLLILFFLRTKLIKKRDYYE